MPWVAIDKNGQEFISKDEPKVCIEYNVNTKCYETVLTGNKAKKFNALSINEKINYVTKEYLESPFSGKQESIHLETLDMLNNNVIQYLSEMSYEKNRNLRAVNLPKGSIRKLIGRDLIFEDEAVEIVA